MMKSSLLALFLCLLALPSHADVPEPATPEHWLAQPQVQSFIAQMVKEEGFSQAQMEDVFAQAVYKPNILKLLEQPATNRPYYAFRPNFVNAQRIRLGVAWWQKHAQLLEMIAKHYRVEAQYLVAILGVETMWGANTGQIRVLDALSTIAFHYPRRAEFFRKELKAFLLLARSEGQSIGSFTGSYAGAMGWPQFMPSSFHQSAQDWDQDGRHDIWQNPADILASVANYFVQHGWQQGEPLVIAASVEGDQYAELVADKFNLHYRLSELERFGVQPQEAVQGDPLAVLAPLEHSPGEVRHWLGLANFYAITRYNRSTHYAMAVHELAQAINAAYHDPTLLPVAPAAHPRKQAPRKLRKNGRQAVAK